jgi:hypothetical protein
VGVVAIGICTDSHSQYIVPSYSVLNLAINFSNGLVIENGNPYACDLPAFLHNQFL